MTTKTKMILSIILTCIVTLAGIFGIQVYSSCSSSGNFDFDFRRHEVERFHPVPVEDNTNTGR